VEKPDFCTLSPDTIGRFGWTAACREHDRRYAEGTGSRWNADYHLWADMMETVRSVDTTYKERLRGKVIALLYWVTVRLFGWLWWDSRS